MEAGEEVSSTLMPHHDDSSSHTSTIRRLKIRKDQSTLIVGKKKSFVNAVFVKKKEEIYPKQIT